MTIKFKKLHASAIIPKYATDGAACFDLHVIEPGLVRAGDSRLFRTGLAVEIPEGHVMQIYSRSGHGFKHGIRLSNAVGTLDSDYRGEIMVRLHNDSGKAYTALEYERVAQAMIIPVQQWDIVEVNELTDTERGTGGLGSTGR